VGTMYLQLLGHRIHMQDVIRAQPVTYREGCSWTHGITITMRYGADITAHYRSIDARELDMKKLKNTMEEHNAKH
jgi:hypothetical protein